jgi:hypothetical protein
LYEVGVLKSSENARPASFGGVRVVVDPEPVDPALPVDPDPGVDPDSAVDPDFGAEQLALVPSFEPLHFHVHGPEPATVDDVPFEQRLAEGAEETCAPFADPHAPATGAGASRTATVVLAAEVKSAIVNGTAPASGCRTRRSKETKAKLKVPLQDNDYLLQSSIALN